MIQTHLSPLKNNCSFTAIEQEELLITSKPTICLLDPIPTNLLKELLPVAEEPLFNIIRSCPKTVQASCY